MKKTTFSLLALVCAITCAFGLAACDGNDTVAIESITLNQTTLELTVGEEKTLTATVAPDNATDKPVRWSSSNPAVATVDGAGKVSAKASGDTTVTATAGEKSATCEITVSPAISYTVTQQQWESVILNLMNPLPFKEQNFAVRGEITCVGWDRNNETWHSEAEVQIDEFQVDGDKYYWHLSIGSEYEDSFYEQWTEQDGYYLQTRYDYWNGAWDMDEDISEMPCEEDELSLDGMPHLNLADFEWNNFQYDENEHCYVNRSPIDSKYGQIDGDTVIYNVLTNVKVYFENGKPVKFTMNEEQATRMKGSAVVTFVYGETEIVLPQVN